MPRFPSTRYQGSKRKLAGWIWENVAPLAFESALDIFGGTGCVAYEFKAAGKRVIYNDMLRFNWNIGLALIQNAAVRLDNADIECVVNPLPGIETYPSFIARTFEGIYFTSEENVWLDRAVFHIDHSLDHPIKQALARFALYQSCITKRPYNLFHRANLYMRQAEVQRSFGNKSSWDKPFEAHFRAFAAEANAAVFDNGQANIALCGDVFDAPTEVDLVYIDPPYINGKGIGVDYYAFYHFLEGLSAYAEWPALIDATSKHRRLKLRPPSPWTNSDRIRGAFADLFDRYRKSILVVSYRGDGIPSHDDLVGLLRRAGRRVIEAHQDQKYVLSTRGSEELLLIAP